MVLKRGHISGITHYQINKMDDLLEKAEEEVDSIKRLKEDIELNERQAFDFFEVEKAVISRIIRNGYKKLMQKDQK